MPLTIDQFKALRDKGVSLDNIIQFEKGVKPPEEYKPKGMLEKAGDVGKWAITPFQSAESVRRTPIESQIASVIPAVKMAMGIPRLGPITPEAFSQEGAQEVSAQTSPLGIATSIPFLGSMSEVARAGMPAIDEAAMSMSRGLTKGAEEGYKSVLGPKGVAMTQRAEKIAPQLAREKPFAFTREGLQRGAERRAEEGGQAIEEAYSKIPGAKVDVLPLHRKISELQKENMIPGTNQISSFGRSSYNALEGLKQDLTTLWDRWGRRVPIQEMRDFRQKLDGVIARGKGVFGKTGGETVKLDAQKTMANSIRSELGKQYPDIAKVNRTFHLWSETSDILDNTIKKSKGKGAGIDVFGGISKGAEGTGHPFVGAIFRHLENLVKDNVAWKTFDASQKARLADFLSRKEYSKAFNLLQNAAAITKTISVDTDNQ